ncbi:hypothetical protein HIK07_16505 [Cronobacter sakazakii]|uniref:hypothetical protein n=1 Tax=Cronobacter sakazakii TaxID=28141 RepID=UPI000A1589B0|nr:hypothetical protein [Cronobacter sakazakii]MBF4650877.1 hypothetical protein [Cronobacter sakazakii]MBF4898052.1 hypothetical protein [Cronobacter sakazakii]MBF4907595.1 hypothetical protein [Cronobacter sakazakii]PUV77698.1 hypothetical protein B7T09_07765 [Cronobacter sakazakii]PUV99840.1 hypothetical protein B7T12_02165 [Cronobacter sakazakii]
MEILKYSVPIVTFFLGLLSTSYVESIKLKTKNRQLKNAVTEELKDELSDLDKRIKTVDKSIKTRKYKPNSFVHISLPGPIDFIVLDKHLIEIYTDISSHERKAYKRLLDLKNGIAQKRQKVLENFNGKNQDCLSIEQAMLYEMLSLYYILNQLVHSKDNFSFPSIGNDQVVKDAALALGVEFPYYG